MQQIRVDTHAFEGRSNAYLLGAGSDEPTTLIDTGIATPEVAERVRDELAREDVTFADIEQILLTHFHYDHAGLAGEIQAESGAAVYAHPADAELIRRGEDAASLLIERHRDRIAEWGMPAGAAAELREFLRTNATMAGQPVDVTEIETGERFHIGERTIEAVHLPGHTAGHLGYDLGDGEFAAGDTLLPVYTPNIGGADMRVERPLETYLDSLGTFVDDGIDVVWPGHRDRIDDPAGRAREIRGHHRDRTARVIDVLADEGPMDVWAVSAALFGELASIHILHGPGEAFAHLDHLVGEGVAAVEDGQYRLIDETADVERLVPPLSPKRTKES